MDSDFPVDHRGKRKEKKNTDKYLDLAREQGKLQNVMVTTISIVVKALRRVPKCL